MNVAYYVLAFDRETEWLLVHLDLGEEHSRRENSSDFVVYMNITHRIELVIPPRIVLYEANQIRFSSHKG